MNGRLAVGVAAALLVTVRLLAAGDESRHVAARVTYVSGTTIYLGAGRSTGLEPGDSLYILRDGRRAGIVVVFAVSARSSASRSADSTLEVTPGDSVVSVSLHRPLPPSDRPRGTDRTAETRHRGSNGLVHGRIAAQLFASRGSGGGWDILQPSLVIRLDATRMLGSDLSFSFFGRTWRDLSGPATGPPGSRVRLYDLSLRYEPAAGFGIGLGRITSRNVNGLGAFDGGELVFRSGGVSVGVLAGGQPDYRTSSFDPDRAKVAGYVNLRLGSGPWSRNDVTVAYGRQYLQGNLDREFVYLQCSLSPAPSLYLYQSAELDLRELEAGRSTQTARLTNTFFTLSWTPTEWLSTSAGYDATRPAILLETMRTLADSLLDRDLQQGLRVSTTLRLPMRLSATLSGGLRLRSEAARQAQNLGIALRAADLAGTGVSAGIQYQRTRAIYSEGDDITATLESWVTRWIMASVRYNRYAYTVTGRQGMAVATTLSLSGSFRLAGSWYTVVNVDRLWDPGRDAYRTLAELSYHF